NTAYTSRRILALPAAKYIYSGAGTLLAQMAYSYDESYLFLPASVDAVIQHDDANYGDSFVTGRGNLTTVTQYSVIGGVAGSPRTLGMRPVYDTYGNVRGSYDPENRLT